MLWKDWAGYHAVRSFDTCHEREYFALRHSAGVIDVSPLFKYEVYGPDAGKVLAQIMVKDVSQLKIGQVTYLCWCDHDGHILDDGTVTRIASDHFRVTAAEPSFAWFSQFLDGRNVSLEDSTARYCALSVQGPLARDCLNKITDIDMAKLKFFRCTAGQIAGKAGWISRTGYTGDLGFELWMEAEHGAHVYEELMDAGQPYSIMPCGLDAMDVTRIEAGFIMNGVDYNSANHCLIEGRKSTPFEIGLGWCVKLDREPFVGQEALSQLYDHPRKQMVGLDIDWLELEAEFAKHDLPPEVCHSAWRDGRPLYDPEGRFIGQATSGAWSPTLKKNLALGQVLPEYAEPGTQIKIEITVEYERRPVKATVVETPFFNPKRKRQ